MAVRVPTTTCASPRRIRHHVVPLPRRQARVQHRQRVADQAVRPIRQLRDQRHLRHQQDRPAAGLQRGIDGRHVHVGLARRRHARSSSSSPPPGSAPIAASADRCSSARSWAGGADGCRCASGSRSTSRQSELGRADRHQPPRRRQQPASTPSASASSGSVRSPSAISPSRACCTGARLRGGGPSGTTRSTRTRRALTSGARSSQRGRTARHEGAAPAIARGRASVPVASGPYR